MDLPFNPLKWQPTKPLEPGDAELSSIYISDLCRQLNDQTKDVLRHPYDPDLWLRRAGTLSKLRYPELAVGDAYKARVLCHTQLAHLRWRDGWSLGHRMGFWMRDESFHDEERESKLVESLEKMLERCQHVILRDTVPSVGEGVDGRFKRRAYPWMKERHLRRSDELVASINREFVESSVTVGGRTSCVLRRHAFGEGVGAVDSKDLLGVFAARDFEAGEVVLVDRTRVWGCNGPGTNGDRTNLYGSIGCGNPLHPNEESDDTSLDLRWIRDKAGKHASTILRNCKLLLCSIQDGVEHPLDHPLIARTTPTYPKDRVSKFSVIYDIAIPNEALQRFGVDVFANPNYDTWVLFTVDARAINNSCGDPTVELLNPLFSLFNHSCAPNVDWVISADHQSVTVKACKSISKGEQMFVMYDGYLEKQPLEERRKVLWAWLDGPCQCARCLSEEKSQVKGGKTVVKKQWDSGEKPVFPEDLLNLKN